MIVLPVLLIGGGGGGGGDLACVCVLRFVMFSSFKSARKNSGVKGLLYCSPLLFHEQANTSLP